MGAPIVLAVNALIAHLLSPGEMGAYFLVLAVVSLAAVFSQFGMNQTVVRLVAESMGAKNPGRARAAVRLVFQMGLIAAFLVAGILGVGGGEWLATRVFGSSLMAGVIGVAAGLIIVTSCRGLMAEAFRGFHDIRLATFFSGPASNIVLIFLLGLWWVLQYQSNLGQVLALTFFSVATSAVIGGLLLRHRVNRLEGDGQLQKGEVLAVAWPLLITNLTFAALTQADLWIVGMFRPETDVAVYGAAMRLILLVVMPLQIVNAVVSPVIAEMHTQGKKRELERVLRTTTTLAGIPAFIVVVGFIFLGPIILGIVYGDFYRGGATVLALLSMGQLVNVWAGSCGLTLMMSGHERTLMKITIFSGILNVSGAMLAVQHFGLAGVASVAASAMILQNVFMLFLAKRNVGIWTHAQMSAAAIRQVLAR